MEITANARIEPICISPVGMGLEDLMVPSELVPSGWVVEGGISFDNYVELFQPVEFRSSISAILISARQTDDQFNVDDLVAIGSDGTRDRIVFDRNTNQYGISWESGEIAIFGDCWYSVYEWLCRFRSRRVAGCPWQVFWWHAERELPVYLATLVKGMNRGAMEIEGVISRAFDWPLHYCGANGVEFCDPRIGMSIRIKEGNRSEPPSIEITVAKSCGELDRVNNLLKSLYSKGWTQ